MLPFLGIFFAKGLMAISNGILKKALLVLFCLAILYSCFFIVSTAAYYQEYFQETRPALEFVKTLPADSKIVAQRHLGRGIIFISGHDAERDWDEYASMDPDSLYAMLSGLKTKSKVDYLLETCKKNPWNPDSLRGLEKQGKIKKVFSSACSNVYLIN